MNKNKNSLSYLQFALSVALLVSAPVSLVAGVGSLISLTRSKYANDILNSLTQTRFAEATAYSDIGPVATDDSYIVEINTPTVFDVLVNDYEPENEYFNIIDLASATHGTLVLQNNNTQILYTPDLGFYGADSFDYRIIDIWGDSDNGTVNIIVNSPPVAVDDFIRVNTIQAIVLQNQPANSIDIDVLANDTDVDGALDLTSLTISTRPTEGTVIVNIATGVVMYKFTGALYQETTMIRSVTRKRR